MITTRNELGVALIAPEGDYDHGELARAFEQVFTLFPGGRAPGLVLDLSRAHPVDGQSVVRVRERTRLLSLHAERFGWRVAVVAPVPALVATDVTATDVAARMTRSYGVAYRVCRDVAEARRWALGTPPAGGTGGAAEERLR